MRGCLFFFFSVRSDAEWKQLLYLEYDGEEKTQFRVNTLLVFIHTHKIVQEYQIHMEHCDWLLLMSY